MLFENQVECDDLNIEPVLKLVKTTAENLGLRVGQTFLNAVYPRMKNPELFYERDEHKALATIRQMLLDYQNCKFVMMQVLTFRNACAK